MQVFENDLNEVFVKYGYNLRDNLGRRNALLSQAQEKEVARALRTIYKNVIDDGAPGKPDVQIVDINKELECKLSSGSGKSKTFSLQTDYITLTKKGSLDYLYILTSPDFTGFCVLFFQGLTIDDFFPPGKGSRGKSRMNKALGMKKCKILHGKAININRRNIVKYAIRRDVKKIERKARFAELIKELKATPNNDRTKKRKIMDMCRFEIKRFRKAIKKFDDKMQLWMGKPDSFSFKLLPLESV
jgi:hypothetical protein